MLSEFLRLEWERRRLALLLVAAVCFGVPVAAFANVGWGGARPGELESGLLGGSGMLLLAALWIAALGWGAGAWRDERRGGWIYALSLPVGRVQLFALRYLAGLAWLALPLAVLGVTASVLAGMAELPPGVYAYPGAFFRWSALTMWTLYTGMFVLAARFERPWVVLLSAVLVYIALNLAMALGTFPALAALLEVINQGDLSPVRLVRDAQLLFGF